MYDLFLSPAAKTSRSTILFWRSLSLVFAVLYSFLALQQAFGSEYVVQDDARQHVFWMQRFADPQLFPNDLIADYFQSVAPWGYTNFYRFFALLGINPLLLSKLLPIALCLGTAAFAFEIGMQLLSMPFTGFLASLLTSQMLWAYDDLASASPRAFMPLIFLAFLYYLMRRSLLPCLVLIALEGLFYPQYVFVFAGILLLQPVRWQGVRPQLSRERQDYMFCIAGLIVAFLVLLPFALATSEFGPTITATEAKQLPEFFAGGRSQFFSDDPWRFWVRGTRSGICPTLEPPLLIVGIFLPVLLRYADRFPLARQVSSKVKILGQIAIVGVFLYFAAHLLLFKLHLPSRYSSHTLRFVLVFATALTLTILLHTGWHWLREGSRSRWQKLFIGGLAALTGATLLFFPSHENFPDTNYQAGKDPELYQFLAQQPKDSLTASLIRRADFIPTLAGRSLLVSREYGIPYHVGYANQFRQRATDLIEAQYTPRLAELAKVTRAYGIDFWLIDRDSFSRGFLEEEWVKQYPTAVEKALESLQQGNPALKRLSKRCTVFEANDLTVVEASCVLRAANIRSASN